MAAVIAFSSGKGGVGKTNISTNIGLSLVDRNQRVCLFDADTGLANINILMGITPSYTIEHVLNGQKTIDEIMLNLPSGITVVPAASGIQHCTDLNKTQLSQLTSALDQLEKRFDYILVDTAAGIDSNVLDFVASAQYRVIVITSEPTSLTDSFALLKMLMVRGVKQSIFILVNRVNDYKSSQVIFQRFKTAVKKYLKIDVYYLGYLPVDEHINKAVSQQIPVVIAYPDASVSCGFASLADIIKKKFRNDKGLPYFSRYWSKAIEKPIKKGITVTANNSETDKKSKDISKPLPENKLSAVYKQLGEQNLTEPEFKELLLTLEMIYEKKHKKALRNVDTLVAMLLAEGDEEKIQQLHHSITQSFERQFEKKIQKPESMLNELLHNDQFSKQQFDQLMDSCNKIYQQRFDQKYFNEGNKLLTQIQRLLANK